MKDMLFTDDFILIVHGNSVELLQGVPKNLLYSGEQYIVVSFQVSDKTCNKCRKDSVQGG